MGEPALPENDSSARVHIVNLPHEPNHSGKANAQRQNERCEGQSAYWRICSMQAWHQRVPRSRLFSWHSSHNSHSSNTASQS
jgi:hypothetical protein